MRRFLQPPCPVIRAPAQPPRHLPALPSALVVVTLLHNRCHRSEPWRRPRVQATRRRRGPGRGGRRSSGHRDTRGSPVHILSDIGDTLSGEGRAARRTPGARGSGTPRLRPGTRGAGAVAGWVRWGSHVLRNGHAARRWAGTRGQGASAGGPPPRVCPSSARGCAPSGRSPPAGTWRALPLGGKERGEGLER